MKWQDLSFYSGIQSVTKEDFIDGEEPSMKKARHTERCTETFDQYCCSKPAGHFGKHLSLDDGWFGWTDQGKARILAEREAAAKKQQ